MYVTASKDGSLGVWDGVTAQCIRPIVGAHGSMEATSASFTKDQRYRILIYMLNLLLTKVSYRLQQQQQKSAEEVTLDK